MHKKPDKFKNTSVTVQIETQQFTEKSHVKHVELYTAKLTIQSTPMNTRINVTIVCIFSRLHQYLFLVAVVRPAQILQCKRSNGVVGDSNYGNDLRV